MEDVTIPFRDVSTMFGALAIFAALDKSGSTDNDVSNTIIAISNAVTPDQYCALMSSLENTANSFAESDNHEEANKLRLYMNLFSACIAKRIENDSDFMLKISRLFIEVYSLTTATALTKN